MLPQKGHLCNKKEQNTALCDIIGVNGKLWFISKASVESAGAVINRPAAGSYEFA